MAASRLVADDSLTADVAWNVHNTNRALASATIVILTALMIALQDAPKLL
jgi:hypothetical protein